MWELVRALVLGLIVGGIFSFLRLPIPAPSTLAGILGVVGLFAGMVIVRWFLK